MSYNGFINIKPHPNVNSRKAQRVRNDYTATLIKSLNHSISILIENKLLNIKKEQSVYNVWFQLYDVLKEKNNSFSDVRLIAPDFIFEHEEPNSCLSLFFDSNSNAKVVNSTELKSIFKEKNSNDYFLHRDRYSWSIIRVSDGSIILSDTDDRSSGSSPCRLLSSLELMFKQK
jgi:hypothetical protein